MGDEQTAFLAGSKMEVTFVTQEEVGTFWHFIWSNDYHCLERSFLPIPRSRIMALSCFRSNGRVSKLAPWVKVITANPDHLGWNLRTHDRKEL